MSNKKCCVPGCVNSEGTQAYPLHKFPNPDKKDLFNTWVYAIGGDILQLENEHILKYRRVCHIHFEEKYWCRNNRLSKIAIPTKNMPGLSSSKFITPERKALTSIQVPQPSASKAVAPNAQLSQQSFVDDKIKISCRFFIYNYCKELNNILSKKRQCDDDEDLFKINAKRLAKKCFKRKINN